MSSPHLTACLAIFTLNEIEGMKKILPQIKREWVDQIMLVDGGSTDGTIEYAASQGIEVHIQKVKTWDNAYKTSLDNVRCDIVVDFSPDGNSDAKLIPELIAKVREGYDMVIASRYIGGAKSEDDSWFTRLGNWGFTTLINLIFRGHFTDSLVIFRAYRMSMIRDVGLFENPNHQFTTQSCIRCAKFKRKVMDIPGDEPARIGGESKLRPFYNGMLILKLIAHELRIGKNVHS